jgi:23S rRNA pseudouridine1911/1915/1917 synthase
MKEKFTYTVTIEDETKELQVKELLRHQFNFSSRLRTKIKKHRGVMLNGSPAEPWAVPKAGDVIAISIPDEVSYFIPEAIPISPIYEDDDLLIINKQPGVVVHPTNGHPDHTIANGVTQYMEDTNQSFKIRFINRLDRDTSGLLALGKNSHAQDGFVKQMKSGLVEKRYLAVVKGILSEDEGTIDEPLGRPDPDQVHRGVVAGGNPSVTHFRVIKRFDTGYTLLELILETGRTHQIRVHLSHLGYPIVGDTLYGTSDDSLIKRQALHAESLSFLHPVTGKPLTLKAPLPEDMNELLNRID